MASKRLAASAVDWGRLTKVCPKNQIEMLRAVKVKHDSFLGNVPVDEIHARILMLIQMIVYTTPPVCQTSPTSCGYEIVCSFVDKKPVHALPDSLPKIDFAVYKSRLPNPAMADAFQKSYEALSIPYPKDKDNLMAKVETENSEKVKEMKAFVQEIQAEMKDLKVFLEKMDSLPKYQEMTEEMLNYYFPETAMDPKRPTIWPHNPAEQPYNPDFKYIK